MACEKESGPPVARLTAFPLISDTTTLFELEAGQSVNGKGLKNSLSYRWNFNGDSLWDTEYREESAIGHYFRDPGEYTVIVEVTDFFGLADTASITISVFGRNKNTGTLRDSRDESEYRIVRIHESWWMAENLHYGITIDKSIEQKDNDTVEMYRWTYYPAGDTIGGIYRWQEAMNYNLDSRQGICPDGWHIPTYDEFSSLFAGMPSDYAIRYYGTNGLSGLNLDISNWVMKYHGADGIDFYGYQFGFWSSSFKRIDGQIRPGLQYFSQDSKVVSIGYAPQSGPENHPNITFYLPVRCIKD